MLEGADTSSRATVLGLTRRQALKGGALGGAVLWTAPTVQLLGMTSADAASKPPTPTPPPVDCEPTPACAVIFFRYKKLMYWKLEWVRSGWFWTFEHVPVHDDVVCGIQVDKRGSPAPVGWNHANFLSSKGIDTWEGAPPSKFKIGSGGRNEWCIVDLDDDCELIDCWYTDGNEDEDCRQDYKSKSYVPPKPPTWWRCRNTKKRVYCGR
jgi:hypothetical protein